MTRGSMNFIADLLHHEFVVEDRSCGGGARSLPEDFKKMGTRGQDTMRPHGGRAPQVQRLGSVTGSCWAEAGAVHQGGVVLPRVIAPAEEAGRPRQAGGSGSGALQEKGIRHRGQASRCGGWFEREEKGTEKALRKNREGRNHQILQKKFNRNSILRKVLQYFHSNFLMTI